MTKKSILCYEKNGGGCRNRVSLANNYICSAGHRRGAKTITTQKLLPDNAVGIDLSKISFDQRENLAEDLSTPAETLIELAKDKNVDILKAVAWNRSAPPEALSLLVKSGHWYILKAVAWNRSAPPETLAELAKSEDWGTRKAVACNSSASPETHISLAQQGHPPFGFARGKTIDELTKGIELVNQYSDTFGRAYLDRLTYNSLLEDETHPKRRALIGYAYAKLAESEADGQDKLYYKEHIKALFPDDQEMAEMIGY